MEKPAASVSDRHTDSEYVAAFFQTADRDRRTHQHNRSLRAIANFARHLGWSDAYPRLGDWGTPDLLLRPPHSPPWLIEYKSYSPGPSDLRNAVLQAYGYLAALGPDRIARTLVVVLPPVTPIEIPPALAAVTVTTPDLLLKAIVNHFTDDLNAGRVTLDDLPAPPRTSR